MDGSVCGDPPLPTVVEDAKGEWRVDPRYLVGDFAGRTALLSPFDRLVHDRGKATTPRWT
jgi:uncharacterized protein